MIHAPWRSLADSDAGETADEAVDETAGSEVMSPTSAELVGAAVPMVADAPSEENMVNTTGQDDR